MPKNKHNIYIYNYIYTKFSLTSPQMLADTHTHTPHTYRFTCSRLETVENVKSRRQRQREGERRVLSCDSNKLTADNA